MATAMEQKKVTRILLVLTSTSFCISAIIEEDFYLKRSDCPDKFLQTGALVQIWNNINSAIGCASICSSDQLCATFSISNSDCRTSSTILDGACSNTDGLISAEIFQKAQFTCYNGGVYNYTAGYCTCYGGYVGSQCERLAKECSELGLYSYYPEADIVVTIQPSTDHPPFSVLCNNEFGGGRTVIQRHFRTGNAFEQPWSEYANGFGNLMTDHDEFWLGNDNIHILTSALNFNLVVEMATENWGAVWQQIHTGFRVDDSNAEYRMSYVSSSPTQGNSGLGDSLLPVNNTLFCTADVNNNIDPGVNCGDLRKCGFWLCDAGNKCGSANPNGPLQHTGNGLRLEIFGEVFWVGLGNISPWFVQMWLEL